MASKPGESKSFPMTEKTDKDNCSFCGKSRSEVNHLIAEPEVQICNECVEMCNTVLTIKRKKMTTSHEKTKDNTQKSTMTLLYCTCILILFSGFLVPMYKNAFIDVEIPKNMLVFVIAPLIYFCLNPAINNFIISLFDYDARDKIRNSKEFISIDKTITFIIVLIPVVFTFLMLHNIASNSRIRVLFTDAPIYLFLYFLYGFIAITAHAFINLFFRLIDSQHFISDISRASMVFFPFSFLASLITIYIIFTNEDRPIRFRPRMANDMNETAILFITCIIAIIVGFNYYFNANPHDPPSSNKNTAEQ